MLRRRVTIKNKLGECLKVLSHINEQIHKDFFVSFDFHSFFNLKGFMIYVIKK